MNKLTSKPTLTFFNNKGGVGKTTLVMHVAWMMARLGKRVVIVDCDPQANLTAALLSETTLETLWDSTEPGLSGGQTIFRCVEPLTKTGDVREPQCIEVRENLWLLPGDLALAGFESHLANEWPRATSSDSRYRALSVLTSLWTVAQKAATVLDADLIILDVGPNLGAINRSALIGSDF
jgi:chromosome partitioning protein